MDRPTSGTWQEAHRDAIEKEIARSGWGATYCFRNCPKLSCLVACHILFDHMMMLAKTKQPIHPITLTLMSPVDFRCQEQLSMNSWQIRGRMTDCHPMQTGEFYSHSSHQLAPEFMDDIYDFIVCLCFTFESDFISAGWTMFARHLLISRRGVCSYLQMFLTRLGLFVGWHQEEIKEAGAVVYKKVVITFI